MLDEAPANTMEQFPAEPVDATSLPCQQYNRLWLENLTGTNLSIAATVGSRTSGMLPQTASEPTLLSNSPDGSAGAVKLAVNGEVCTAVKSIDRSWIQRSEDVQIGIVVGQSRQQKAPVNGPGNTIPVGHISDALGTGGGTLVPPPEADLSLFLEDGMSESNTDVDLVFVGITASGPNALPPGQYQVDDLSEEQASWVLDSILANTIASTGNEAGGVAAFGRGVARNSPGMVWTALKEIILQGRFYIKSIASWGGKNAIVFKGLTGSRSFLTTAIYGLNNNKMTYISSYAKGLEAVQTGSVSGAGRVALGAAKGNLIGFFISAAFDVNEFVKSEDPEQNWGGLLGALGVTFVKVWAAGVAGILLAATVVSVGAAVVGAVVGGAVAAPVALTVAIGVGISIGAGVLLDWLDRSTGFKEAARKIGNKFGNAASAALKSSWSFVQEMVDRGQSLLDQWFPDFDHRSDVEKQNDAICALYCNDLAGWARSGWRIP